MMSKETLPDSIDGYTRESIDEYYEIALTDKQWELLVEYASNPDPDYETTADLVADFVNKIDLLESASDEYEKIWLQTHGNPYPFDKDGNNVEESND